MNEYQEEVLEKKLQEFSDNIRKAAEDTLTDLHCGLLPYVGDDTVSNAQLQATDIVMNILEGNFVWEDEYIIVRPAREFSPKIRVKFSSHQYDLLRDKIIERMPSCPKDAKIKALEEHIAEMYRNY